ncbi:protein kinase [Alienimonas sp. DA493]|uniref:protein kinase domain-containing protein n=1 Tax=Alienimonas sp. DA493 TaxID=3373605 RepID=UPI0037551D22
MTRRRLEAAARPDRAAGALTEPGARDTTVANPGPVAGPPGDARETIPLERDATLAGDGDRPAGAPRSLPAATDFFPPPPADDPDRRPLAFGRYRIERPLGRGGMGAVFLAWDCKLERRVALKAPVAVGTRQATRFLREARAAAALDHPAICPIYDVGEAAGRQYLTMPHLAGGSLRDLIDGPRPVREATELVLELADAMAHAHDRGVIHRDLKPANVMRNDRGRLLITDFGLACREGADARVTREGEALGTPAYMSPEQMLGDQEHVGARSDVYALGVMFYELLTGRLPFQGSAVEVISQTLIREPPPPRELRPELPPELDAIWRRMTARDPAARYGSMHEVREALATHLSGAAAARRSRSPRRTLAAVAAVALLAAAAFVLRPPGGPTPAETTKLPPVSLPAPDPPEEPILDAVDAVDADGWISLFNGRDLADWKGHRENFAVVDGVLVGAIRPDDAGEAPWRRLRFAASFSDHELRLVARTAGPGRKSLNVRRSPTREAKATVQLDGSYAPLGSIEYWRQSGEQIRRHVDEPTLARARAARSGNGEPAGWDVMTIRVVGSDVAVRVNGVPVAEATLPQLTPAGGVTLEFDRSPNGTNRIELRSLRVRPLRSDAAFGSDAAAGGADPGDENSAPSILAGDA